jgi:hypothetical protein
MSEGQKWVLTSGPERKVHLHFPRRCTDHLEHREPRSHEKPESFGPLSKNHINFSIHNEGNYT